MHVNKAISYEKDNLVIIKEKYKSYGFVCPQIIFWNINNETINDFLVSRNKHNIITNSYKSHIWRNHFSL